jgi:hypothetical protein
VENKNRELNYAFRAILLILAILCYHTLPALAQKCGPTDDNLRKSAFVVGINKYDLLPDLHNPVNDAIDLAKALHRLNFTLKLDTNKDLKTLSHDIQAWSNGLDTCDIAILYFAGHGGQLDNENYLMPSNGNTHSRNTVKSSGLRISDLLDSMKTHNHHLNIIIADACRNDPVMGTKNKFLSKGFGLMGSPGNDAMICFATGVGKTVDDYPDRRNSLFTRALLKYIELPKTPFRSILDKVHDQVVEDSPNGQDPWVNESGGSNFNHCLFIPFENGSDIDSTDNVLTQKYKGQANPALENEAAYFKRKVDTIRTVIYETRDEVIKELGDDLQPNQSGSVPNYLNFTFFSWWAIEYTYSTVHSIWMKVDVSLSENTLKFTISGSNRTFIPASAGPDYLSITEQQLNLKDTIELPLSLYVTDWKRLKQTVRHYYLARAAALQPKYGREAN